MNDALLILGTLSAASWALTIGTGLLAILWRWLGRGPNRAAAAFLALLRSRDIGWCTNWLSPLFVVSLADKLSGRQMISSYVGKAAANGHRWARWAADAIDLFLGERHCERAFRHYQGLDD